MPIEHLEKLREVHIKDIKNAYIYKCSCQKWLNVLEEELKYIEQTYTEEEKKTSQTYKMEIQMNKRMNSKEYYEKVRGRYAKDLEILQNPKATRRQLLRVFKRHDLSFDLNKTATDGSYLLQHFGWCDNYRVSGHPYPCATHHNAQEAIEWLENFSNGNNICIDGRPTRMCDELKEIIYKFFTEFPNGTIHYG